MQAPVMMPAPSGAAVFRDPMSAGDAATTGHATGPTFHIHRYPVALIDRVELDDGRSVLVRPVLPQDSELQQRFVRALSADSRYRRFHAPVNELSEDTLDWLTRVDYSSHLALLAETFDEVGNELQVAEARYVRGGHGLPFDVAEFALAVADDWQGTGLGTRLLGALLARARVAGLRKLRGSVLADNRAMLKLAQRLGARVRGDIEDAHLMVVEFVLQARSAS